MLAAALAWLLSGRPVGAAEIGPPSQPENVSGPAKLTVTVGKSLIIDSPLNIQRFRLSSRAPVAGKMVPIASPDASRVMTSVSRPLAIITGMPIFARLNLCSSAILI